MKTITQVTYDQIAPSFAQVNTKMPENLIVEAQQFLNHIARNGLCLDLGCGAGRDSAWFGQHGLKMVGADFSIGMLAQSRKIVSCPLVQMDMRALGFANHSFAGIWCNASLLHLPKVEAPLALQEMYRVLCDDGILDLAVQQGEEEGLEINPYDGNAQRFFARYHLDEMSKLLAENGFVVLESETIPLPNRTWLRFVARVVR
jgi:ubiquinone/menaquinone biosynthesis C-methylase UbiE